ncbi:hypothetical protein OH687_31765 [Burkholderia anthina]|nr:hypothetical protein OH687_31765 [Burkholderia anthina]
MKTPPSGGVFVFARLLCDPHESTCTSAPTLGQSRTARIRKCRAAPPNGIA